MAEEIVIVGAGRAREGGIRHTAGRGPRPETSRRLSTWKARARSRRSKARPVLQGLDAMDEYAKSHDVTAILGHGNNSRSKAILPQLESLGVRLRTAIHPSAIISPDVEIGARDDDIRRGDHHHRRAHRQGPSS